MENEKISVIVPCYNIAELIENTVMTICNQTYKNIEIILVNDGSKDNTASVLEELSKKDKRIKVIHKSNGGVTSARLTGVEAASGDWIGFVDGDDAIEPDMYERLLCNAKEHNADISHCGYQMVFPSRVDYYYNTGRLLKQDNEAGLKDLLEGSFIEPGLWNKLFKNVLFSDGMKKMDLSVKINEDLLMNYYLFEKSKVAIFEDFCLYHYMVREGSAATSKLNENKLRDPLLVLKTIRDNVKENEMLCNVVDGRIADKLITLSTLRLADQADLIKPYRCAARKELRKMLPKLLKGRFGKRIKLLSLWASLFPASYNLVHTVYARFRGTDRKYEVS